MPNSHALEKASLNTLLFKKGLEPLLLKPEALCAPDLELLSRVVKDTFVERVCSYHHVSSPCDCGEPLNKAARDLFEEPSFDPLELNKTRHNARIKTLSIFVAYLIISLALTESISQHGINLGTPA